MEIFKQIQKEKDQVTPYVDYPYLVYGRVSTDKDEQVSSIENQIDICRDWLEKNSYEWNPDSVFLDNGISGTTILARKAMTLILEKARKREIKMVVFKSISRLARDLKDSLEIKELLLSANVRVVTIEEQYDSLYEGKNDYKFEMFSMFAAQYPKSLSVSISAAHASKVRRGEFRGGRPPYGYRIKDKHLIIQEDEAEVVRMIFDLYNNKGLGFKKVTYELNNALAKGEIVGPERKDKWQVTTIQTIIQNPMYAGVVVLNKYTHVKVDGRKKQIRNPMEKWNIFYDQHPRIISEEEWEKANTKSIIATKRRITPWNELRGLVKCDVCGSNMVVNASWKAKKDGTKTHWDYLKCSSYRRGGEYGCVNHAPIKYEEIRQLVISKLQQHGHDMPLNLKNNMMQKKEKLEKDLKARIESLKGKNKRLIELYLEDQLISKAEFQVKRSEIEAETKKAEDELFLLSSEKEEQLDIQNIKHAFTALNNTSEDLHEVFKTLIKEIRIGQTGELEIEYTFQL
ncbi:recombinase family protein [Terribacillus saccharophilus]|uniref:recombinase family protein n=1 Tax=Terribacillus saccharophilus TaxID=361277 RepID=UPI000BA66B88|nr:recombinase family protein [Terribacillus saccharophilus]PAF37854.1 recombinase family protein [Terribacillus saccharophilus]